MGSQRIAGTAGTGWGVVESKFLYLRADAVKSAVLVDELMECVLKMGMSVLRIDQLGFLLRLLLGSERPRVRLTRGWKP